MEAGTATDVFANAAGAKQSVRKFAPKFDTVALAVAETISADVVEVAHEALNTTGGLTAAQASARDEAGGKFERTGTGGADVPAHTHYFTDASSKKFAYNSRTIKAYTVGKTVHTTFNNYLDELAAKGSGAIEVRDTHLLTQSISKTDFGDIDVHILGTHGRPTFKLDVSAADSTIMLRLWATSPYAGRVTVEDIEFDASACAPATVSPAYAGALMTGVSFHNWDKVRLWNVGGPGGQTFLDGRGDSCVSHVGCRDFAWDGGNPRYWSDLCFYPGGGLTHNDTSDDGLITVFKNAIVEYCSGVVSLKREGERLLVNNISAYFCQNGISVSEAGTVGAYSGPAKNLEVYNSRLIRIVGTPLTVKGECRAIIQGTLCRDWGIGVDGVGTGTPGTIKPALNLLGSSNGLYSGNTFEMVDFPAGAASTGGVGSSGGVHIGARTEASTINIGASSIRYTPNGNVFKGNVYRRLDRGVNESASGQNEYSNEYMSSDVVDPVRSTGFNPDSHAIYTVQGSEDTGTLGASPFTTTSSSTTVSVAHTAHGRVANSQVRFSGATAVGGITVDGVYTVVSVTNANAYTITHGVAASSSTSGGGSSVAYAYRNASASYERIGGDIWRTDSLLGSKTYDPASLADGAGATTTVTVTGAVLGDFVDRVSFSLDLQGITVTAWVSATDTVSVRFQNETGGVLDLASGTLRVQVRPKV